MPSTTLESNAAQQSIRVTHPFHPWSGQSFEFVTIRRTWRQDRVFFLADDGTQVSLPSSWTDAIEPDPFVTISAGRSACRIADLFELADLIDVLDPKGRRKSRVRTILPDL